MNIIRPVTITDAMFVSSTVAEADYAEFAMGTTYAEGANCIVATGVEILIIDVAPASAWEAGDIITGQSSGKTSVCVAQLTTLTYQVRERNGSYTLNEVIGVTGTAAKLADQGSNFPTITAATDKIHKIYESLSAGNVGNYPPTDVLAAVPKWLAVGATNRWKAFDTKSDSQTSQATSINYVIKPGMIDSIAFLNLEAASIRIVETDPVDGVVYDVTTSLINETIIIDWYAYFFEPLGLLKTDMVTLLIPPYAAAEKSITISYPGSIAKCGAIIFGSKFNIGNMNYSPSISITDYSTKTVDDFGNYVITQRPWSKKISFDVTIANIYLDEIYRQLALYRSSALVWVGSETYGSLIVYGFYKDLVIVIPYPAYSSGTLEIEGLI